MRHDDSYLLDILEMIWNIATGGVSKLISELPRFTNVLH